MFVEVIDLVAEWLAHGTYGVNALLAAVPRKGGDGAPPNVASILAETRNGDIARGHYPQDPALYPALTVNMPNQAWVFTGIRNAVWDVEPFPVLIGYAVREVQSEIGTRNAGYTLRAVLRSLWALEDPGNATAVAARSRNDITIRAISTIELLPGNSEIPDVTVLGGMRVGFAVRDTKPGG